MGTSPAPKLTLNRPTTFAAKSAKYQAEPSLARQHLGRTAAEGRGPAAPGALGLHGQYGGMVIRQVREPVEPVADVSGAASGETRNENGRGGRKVQQRAPGDGR